MRRYKDDVYDRIWDPPVPIRGWTTINTSEKVSVDDPLFFQPAPAVMNTAATPSNESAPMAFFWQPPDLTTAFFVYMYFAELKVLGANESREFDVFLNGKRWHNESLSPRYLKELVFFSTAPLTGGNYQISFVRTPNSTLPPILNALEVYRVLNFSQSETSGEDGMNFYQLYAFLIAQHFGFKFHFGALTFRYLLKCPLNIDHLSVLILLNKGKL